MTVQKYVGDIVKVTVPVRNNGQLPGTAYVRVALLVIGGTGYIGLTPEGTVTLDPGQSTTLTFSAVIPVGTPLGLYSTSCEASSGPGGTGKVLDSRIEVNQVEIITSVPSNALVMTDLNNIDLFGLSRWQGTRCDDVGYVVFAIRNADKTGQLGEIKGAGNCPYRDGSTIPAGPVLLHIFHEATTATINIDAGDFIKLVYDGGKVINVFLPRITENIYLWIDNDGSTYYDKELTQLAWLSTEPPPPPPPPPPLPPDENHITRLPIKSVNFGFLDPPRPLGDGGNAVTNVIISTRTMTLEEVSDISQEILAVTIRAENGRIVNTETMCFEFDLLRPDGTTLHTPGASCIGTPQEYGYGWWNWIMFGAVWNGNGSDLRGRGIYRLRMSLVSGGVGSGYYDLFFEVI